VNDVIVFPREWSSEALPQEVQEALAESMGLHKLKLKPGDPVGGTCRVVSVDHERGVITFSSGPAKR
jgi:hypothetical protein